MDATRSMGLDVGERRIGVALSDPAGILASPFTILERADQRQDIDAILEIAATHDVSVIVVGLPRSLNGTLGQQAASVRDFAHELRSRTDIPMEYRDERLTTVSARRLMQDGRSGRSRRKGPRPEGRRQKTRYDAAAAAVILQSYLEEARCQDGR